MSVFNGQPVSAETVNDAFMSRTADTSTTGKVGLQNAGSASMADAQKYINKIATATGVSSEADTTDLTYSSTNYVANGDNRKVAIGKLDQAAKTIADDLSSYETSTNSTISGLQGDITSLDWRIDTLELNNTQDVTLGAVGSSPNANGASLAGQVLTLQPASSTQPGVLSTSTQSIAGNKTFTGNVVVDGDLTVNGNTTTLNTQTLDVEDANIKANKGGTNLTAEGAGLTVERPAGDASIQFDSTLASFWKIGVGTLREVVVSGVAQIISGLKTFADGIATDSIVEETLNAGVTIDGVLIKDGLVDGEDVSDIRSDLTAAEGNITNLLSDVATLELNNTQDVTLGAFGSTPNANGASLAGQVLTLQPANSTNPGGVSTGSQTFAGAKTFSSQSTHSGGIVADTKIQTNGTEVWSVANDSTSTGGSTSLVDNLKVATRLTNASLSQLQMMAGAETGKLKVIINDTGNVIVLKHETGATVSERMSLGGADQNLPNGGLAFFMYDTTSRWRLVQIVAGGAGSTTLQGVHRYQVNGFYNQGAALTGPDGAIFFNEPVKVVAVLVYVDIAGSSGATTFRLQYKAPAGSYVNMMTTDGSISASAGNDAEIRTGETKANMTAPVLTSTPYLIAAGGGVRLDIPAQQGGSPNGCGCVIFYEKQ